jgi:replicative DNA helicase
MANLKLTIDDFYSSDFELIAIHTSLEDYKLAFNINKTLELSLSKSQKEISIKSNEEIGFFSWFCYDDSKHDLGWNLLANKTTVASEQLNVGLFNETAFAVQMHLIPELKKADYLLKIENLDHRFDTKKVIRKISEINQISTTYIVDIENIKSINNLIF